MATGILSSNHRLSLPILWSAGAGQLALWQFLGLAKLFLPQFFVLAVSCSWDTPPWTTSSSLPSSLNIIFKETAAHLKLFFITAPGAFLS